MKIKTRTKGESQGRITARRWFAGSPKVRSRRLTL